MSVSPSTEAAGKGSAVAVAPDLKERIWSTLSAEAHQAYSSSDFLPILRMKSPKDPQKEAKNREEILAQMKTLAEEGLAVEVADGVFKARLYFDGDQKLVEHAYIGGTLNVHYRFQSSFFRINVGVLSIFFFRPEKGNVWKARVKDSTLGREYMLLEELKDGTYVLGSKSDGSHGENFIKVEGRYIEKSQLTIEVAGESVRLEDQTTPAGTRVDILTPKGAEAYRKAARSFLKETDSKDHKNVVKRGRFTFQQLSDTHVDFDTGLFGAVVDSLL